MTVEQSPLALELLELLGREEAAREIEIGGGIALWHYSPHRRTNDVDAWWAQESEQSRAAISRVLERLAVSHELTCSHRAQSGYESWDLRRNGKVVFAFQIALKLRRIDSPLASPWGQLRLESLKENISNKMAALVQRGAPRDMLDIATVLQKGLLTSGECWALWMTKNPDQTLDAARSNVLKYLNALEARRPLDSIAEERERESARATRKLIRSFANGT